MRNRPFAIVLIIIAAIAGLAVAAMRLRAPRGPVIFADVHSAPGLREGATVSFRGITVGRVSHIAFVAGGLRLTIALDRADVPLRTNDSARVRPNGMLGDVGLEIVPGAGAAAAAVAGTVLHEATPDEALVRQQAVGEAILNRLAHQAGHDATTDSAAKVRSKP